MKKYIFLLLLAALTSCLKDDGSQPPQGNSPYIAKVYDYSPAPGQFVNELPEYKSGDTKADMIKKAEAYLVGKKNGGLLHLGGFGGYVVFGFDHTVSNVKGQRDIRIMGNAFKSTANPNPDAPDGGSSEPGIIMVSYDANKNGKPDDAWYEIAGSEYSKPATIKGYQITYHRPATETPDVVPEDPNITIKNYIQWQDNKQSSGFLPKNGFHEQSYYPSWIAEPRITLSGTLLAPNGVDESGNGSYWVLYPYGYGYADNAPNSEDDSAFDIGWAVDSEGNSVELSGIDFIKVYTGVNQICGWIGENSTEISAAHDLHMLKEVIPTFR